MAMADDIEYYVFDDSLRTRDNQTEQQCPQCGEWYRRSHNGDWDQEAMDEHADICTALYDDAEPQELGWEPDYELLRQEREIDGEV